MIKNTKFGLRPDDVDEALGSRKLREEVVAAGWLKPVIQRHKLTLYNSADVAQVWARILAGERPEPSHPQQKPARQRTMMSARPFVSKTT